MFKKRVIVQILTIILLGLIPLLWFKNNQVILGHDSGLPFDPINHFIDRWYLWSTHFGFGIDLNDGLIGSVLVIHGLETALKLIGLSLQNVEKIEFIFWFTLPGLMMYYAAYKMWPQKKYLPLIAACIYMINFYLLQGWFAPERTKFSFYSGFPIYMYCILNYFNGRMSLKKSVLLSGITMSILNGGGSIPLYGGMMVATGIIILYENIIYFSLRYILKTISFLAGFITVYFLLNTYWFIPYVKYLFTAFGTALAGQGGAAGTLNWTAYLSSGASFINLFRGQGIPDWYLNPYHAYAGVFMTNPVLITASFAFPLLAYGSLFLVKKNTDKHYIYIIALIGIIALIFASGTKSQLSFIYSFMVLHVPGFAIFRSSFYKFDYVLWLSYAILIGFTLDNFFNWIEARFGKLMQNNIVRVLPITAFIILLILYHYPILNGSFFDYSHEPGKSLTTRVTPPQYIFDFDNWVNHQDQNTRYLTLPPINSANNYISYKWGYWSLATITSTLSRASFVQNDSTTTDEAKALIQEAYKSLLQNDMQRFNNIAQMLGVDDIVLEKDYDWTNASWGTTNPADYEKVLKSNNNFALEKVFGQWQVYKITGVKPQRVTISSKINYLQGDLVSVLSFPFFNPQIPVYVNASSTVNSQYYKDASDIFINPTCNSCSLKKLDSNIAAYNPSILPGSFLYPFIEKEENKVKKTATSFAGKFDYYMTFSDRRVAEMNWMLKSNQKLNYLPQTLDRYIALLTGLKSLEQETWEISSQDENQMAQLLIMHLIQQSSVIENMYQNDDNSPDNKLKMGEAYDLLSELITSTQSHVWSTQNTVSKMYSFDMPNTGQYDLYVKKDTLANGSGDTKASTINFKGSLNDLTVQKEINGWLDFGPVSISSGKNYFQFIDPTVKNLIDGINPILPANPAGINSNNGIYTLTTESRDKCFSIPLSNLDTSDQSEYSVTFKYRNLTDSKDLAFYIQDPGTTYSRLSVNDYFLPNNRSWTTHSLLINPQHPTSSLVFCNGFADLQEKYSQQQDQDIASNTATASATQMISQDVFQLSDIALYKVSTPTIVLYKAQKTGLDRASQVSYSHKSPVEYKINNETTNQPLAITLKDSYNPYWQFCSGDKNCLPLTDSNHFQSYGFANTWYFPQGTNGPSDLYYTPQHLFIICAAVTIASIPILVLIIFWNVLWPKKKSK